MMDTTSLAGKKDKQTIEDRMRELDARFEERYGAAVEAAKACKESLAWDKGSSAKENVSRIKREIMYGAPAMAAMGLLACPAAAHADSSKEIAKNIFGLASNVVILFGGALVVWGGVRFGLALKDQQGGNAMSESIATLGGGVVVIAAGAYFKSLDISWLK
jgi:hypothetical protein